MNMDAYLLERVSLYVAGQKAKLQKTLTLFDARRAEAEAKNAPIWLGGHVLDGLGEISGQSFEIHEAEKILSSSMSSREKLEALQKRAEQEFFGPHFSHRSSNAAENLERGSRQEFWRHIGSILQFIKG